MFFQNEWKILLKLKKKKNIRKQLRMKVKKKIKLKKVENQANMDEHFKLS
jgi:hypothetical protein